MTSSGRRDPSRVSAQPALTTSTGRRWLVWGAALTVISVVMLGALALTRDPVTWVAVALILVLYAAMVVVRFSVASVYPRLVTLASLMGAIAVVALVSVLVVGAAATGGV